GHGEPRVGYDGREKDDSQHQDYPDTDKKPCEHCRLRPLRIRPENTKRQSSKNPLDCARFCAARVASRMIPEATCSTAVFQLLKLDLVQVLQEDAAEDISRGQF